MTQLLAIVEQGGYPNFTALYTELDYKVTMSYSMRKAMTIIRKCAPDVIVAEFNYQTDFRDRTSSLESLLATVERIPKSTKSDIKVIVFYEREYVHQLEKLQAVFSNFEAMAYPIEPNHLKAIILNSAVDRYNREQNV